MKKNGFTLIELLAVIIALAIVLAIAVPRVLNLIDDSKKTAFEISANKLLNEAKKEYSKYAEEKEYIIESKEFIDESFDVKGVLPEDGSIKVFDDGTVAIAVHNDKWCALKRKAEENIQLIPYEGECTVFTPVSCFSYTKTLTEVTITEYDDSCPKNVIIPDEIDGLPITVIGSSAFRSKDLTSLVLPAGLKTIQLYSFLDNLLTKIEFPNSITSIGYASFSSNKLTSVVIPSSVTNLGDHVFSHNHLSSITMPPTYVKMGMAVFNDNLMPTDEAYIYNKNLDGSDNLTWLNSYAGFDRSHADIPNGIVTIGARAFQYTYVKSITLPNTVVTIKNGAFQCIDSTNVVIPNSVLYIEEVAFNGSNITNLTLSNAIKTIGWSAFQSNKIQSVILPSTLTRIEYSAFSGNSMTSITIPSTVTYLGGGAFTSNQLPVSEGIIYGRNSDGSENYSILNSYAGVDVDTLVIPPTVTIIDDNSLEYSGLKSITIPNIITSIGNFAFSHNNLTNITIPNMVSSIGIYAFAGNKITSATIGNNVTTMGYAAFMWNNLTSVTIPSNIAMSSNLPQISSTFNTAYVDVNGSVGGTYTAPSQSGIWTKQP